METGILFAVAGTGKGIARDRTCTVILAIALFSVGALRCGTSSGSRTDGTAPLEITPSLTFDAAEVRAGAALHVYGLGFCAEEGCSPVTIVIDGQAVAQEVSITADGTFTVEAYVPAITHSGSIPAAAEQTRADGTRIRVFARLLVRPEPAELQ